MTTVRRLDDAERLFQSRRVVLTRL